MHSRDFVLDLFAGKNNNFVPVTACFHFGHHHLSDDLLAELEIGFFHQFMPDILKVMNDDSFLLPNGVDPVNNRKSIDRLAQTNSFGEQYPRQIKAMKKIVKALKHKVVIWDTVFNPWFTVRRHLLFKDINLYMRLYRDELHVLMEYVTNSLLNYIEKSLETGVDGIFYSVPAARQYLAFDEYNEFMKPYDKKLISAMKDHVKILTLHVHGLGDLYIEDLVDNYPFDCLSWSDRNTDFDLKKAREIIKKPLMGGINEADNFNYRPYRELEREIDEAIITMKGHPFVLSPGCVLQPQCPTERLQHYFNYARQKRFA